MLKNVWRYRFQEGCYVHNNDSATSEAWHRSSSQGENIICILHDTIFAIKSGKILRVKSNYV